jgi:hypothetical protein
MDIVIFVLLEIAIYYQITHLDSFIFHVLKDIYVHKTVCYIFKCETTQEIMRPADSQETKCIEQYRRNWKKHITGWSVAGL